jgi:hypothetical protein
MNPGKPNVLVCQTRTSGLGYNGYIQISDVLVSKSDVPVFIG